MLELKRDDFLQFNIFERIDSNIKIKRGRNKNHPVFLELVFIYLNKSIFLISFNPILG